MNDSQDFLANCVECFCDGMAWLFRLALMGVGLVAVVSFFDWVKS